MYFSLATMNLILGYFFKEQIEKKLEPKEITSCLIRC